MSTPPVVRTTFGDKCFRTVVLIALFFIGIWVVDLLKLCKTAVREHQHLLNQNLETLKLLRDDLRTRTDFATERVPEPR